MAAPRLFAVGCRRKQVQQSSPAGIRAVPRRGCLQPGRFPPRAARPGGLGDGGGPLERRREGPLDADRGHRPPVLGRRVDVADEVVAEVVRDGRGRPGDGVGGRRLAGQGLLDRARPASPPARGLRGPPPRCRRCLPAGRRWPPPRSPRSGRRGARTSRRPGPGRPARPGRRSRSRCRVLPGRWSSCPGRTRRREWCARRRRWPPRTTPRGPAAPWAGRTRGSAWATLPPMVPRLRTAGSPMTPAAAARAGACAATSDDAAICAWVVRAPTRSRPSATDIPFSSPMRPMSMSAGGAASRSFSSGIRLCPPASTLAPGCLRSSRPISATESAR